MEYKFPTFDDLLHPESLNFDRISNIASSSYCNNRPTCNNCPFDAPNGDCAAINKKWESHRKELLQYVKLNHPEYLL